MGDRELPGQLYPLRMRSSTGWGRSDEPELAAVLAISRTFARRSSCRETLFSKMRLALSKRRSSLS